MARSGQRSGNRRKEREDLNLDERVGAFSDIAFLLIIFFIVATSFIKIKGFNTEIPNSNTDQSDAQQEEDVVIRLEGPGFIRLKDQEVSLDDLRTKLQAMPIPTQRGTKFVKLEQEDHTDYETFYQVMALLQKIDVQPVLVEAAEE
jgi:biopolymer transport protein ExbD